MRPTYPECEKLVSVSSDSNKIGDFLDWLFSQGIILAKNQFQGGELWPINESFERLLARYYDIDLEKVDNERRDLLNHISEL